MQDFSQKIRISSMILAFLEISGESYILHVLSSLDLQESPSGCFRLEQVNSVVVMYCCL